MREGHEIIDKVYAAKSDPDAADSLIRQYMGFIRSETAKFLHRPPEEGRDEEFSIAMLAFYESILGYEKGRGVFLSYAARGIRNRLIDHYRKEKRHANLSSLHEPVEDDAETLKIDRLEDSKNHIQDLHDRNAAREASSEAVRRIPARRYGPYRYPKMAASLISPPPIPVLSFEISAAKRSSKKPAAAPMRELPNAQAASVPPDIPEYLRNGAQKAYAQKTKRARSGTLLVLTS